MATRVAIVGASNLVSFERQPSIACTCNGKCNNKKHGPQVPGNVQFKLFAKGGAKFNHPNREKNADKLFNDALSFNPSTVIIFHDIIMNSLTLPPNLENKSLPVMSPDQVKSALKDLEKKCPCRFVVILVRRRKEDERKLPLGTSRNSGDQPRQFSCDLDVRMNRVLKDNFKYFDLHLSNSSFKINDSAHQTSDSLKQTVGKIVRYFGKF